MRIFSRTFFLNDMGTEVLKVCFFVFAAKSSKSFTHEATSVKMSWTSESWAKKLFWSSLIFFILSGLIIIVLFFKYIHPNRNVRAITVRRYPLLLIQFIGMTIYLTLYQSIAFVGPILEYDLPGYQLWEIFLFEISYYVFVATALNRSVILFFRIRTCSFQVDG